MSRMDKVVKLVREMDLHYLLVDHLPDIFYLTGMKMSFAKLLVSKEQGVLFADGRYFEAVKQKAPCEVKLYKRGKFEKRLRGKIAFDSKHTSFAEYEEMKDLAELIPLEDPIMQFRMIKDTEEIEKLKDSAALNFEAYQYLLDHLKEGITEVELANLYEAYVKARGAEGASFSPLIAFGENSAYPHHASGERAFKKNDIVLFDLGCQKKGYASDMTRMVMPQAPNPQHKRVVKLVDTAAKIALEQIRPGVKVKEIDEAVHEFFKSENVDDHFTHRLGHGIGIDVHEPPGLSYKGIDADLILEPNMVITIEPGLYFPGIGGARHEDMIWITSNGYENFYESFASQTED